MKDETKRAELIKKDYSAKINESPKVIKQSLAKTAKDIKLPKVGRNKEEKTPKKVVSINEKKIKKEKTKIDNVLEVKADKLIKDKTAPQKIDKIKSEDRKHKKKYAKYLLVGIGLCVVFLYFNQPKKQNKVNVNIKEEFANQDISDQIKTKLKDKNNDELNKLEQNLFSKLGVFVEVFKNKSIYEKKIKLLNLIDQGTLRESDYHLMSAIKSNKNIYDLITQNSKENYISSKNLILFNLNLSSLTFKKDAIFFWELQDLLSSRFNRESNFKLLNVKKFFSHEITSKRLKSTIKSMQPFLYIELIGGMSDKTSIDIYSSKDISNIISKDAKVNFYKFNSKSFDSINHVKIKIKVKSDVFKKNWSQIMDTLIEVEDILTDLILMLSKS